MGGPLWRKERLAEEALGGDEFVISGVLRLTPRRRLSSKFVWAVPRGRVGGARGRARKSAPASQY